MATVSGQRSMIIFARTPETCQTSREAGSTDWPDVVMPCARLQQLTPEENWQI